MSDIDLSSYMTLYLETAEKYVQDLKSSLSSLKNNPQDKNALEVLHRSAHSLKSQSIVMGFKSTATLCATIEKVMQQALEASSLNQSLIEDLGKGIDALNESIESIKNGTGEIDLSSYSKILQEKTGVTINIQ